MKDFKKFLEEITIKGNPGVPGEDPNTRGENPYLNDVERRAKQRMNIRPQDVSTRVMPSRKEQELGNRLMGELLPRSVRYTSGHEDELGELAESVFRSLYQELMDRYSIGLDVKIIPIGEVQGWMDQQGGGEQPPPIEFRRVTEEDIKNEVYKRKLANLIIQGEAKNTKHILHSDDVKDGLIEIFGRRTGDEVFNLWDEMTKVADQIDWVAHIDARSDMMEQNPDGMAGACVVDWEEPEEPNEMAEPLEQGDEEYNNDDEDEEEFEAESGPTPIIRARGVDFPMLLHEMVKGLFELLSLGGIPEDERTAKIALGNTGIGDEPEDWRYGPEIAADLRDFINLNNKVSSHPNVREELYKLMIDKQTMPTADFLKLMKGILAKSPEARVKVDELIERVLTKIRDDKEAMDRYNQELEEYNRQMAEFEEEKPKEKPGRNWYDSFDDDDDTIEEPTNHTAAVPETQDFSKMRKSEIQELIDKALDDGDYEKVKKLSQYLGEGRNIYLKELERINESHKFHTRR